MFISKSRYDSLMQNMDGVARIAKARESQIIEKDKLLEAKDKQIEALKAQVEAEQASKLEALQSYVEELASWEKGNKSLAEQLDASQAHALKAINAKSELEGEVDGLRHELREAREKEEDLRCSLDSACEAMTANENRAMELQAENEKLRNIIKHYESSVATTRNQYEDRIKELDATLGKVQDERDRAEDNVRVLEIRLKEVAAERDQAKAAMEGAMSDTAYWKKAVAETEIQLTGMEKAYTGAVKDLEGFKAKCEALAEELAAVKTDHTHLKADCGLLKDDLEAVIARCESAKVPKEVARLVDALKIKYALGCPKPAANAPKEDDPLMKALRAGADWEARRDNRNVEVWDVAQELAKVYQAHAIQDDTNNIHDRVWHIYRDLITYSISALTEPVNVVRLKALHECQGAVLELNDLITRPLNKG